jgi:8-oxo-dGTP pyrophosphatase MutT (NUDIX family)
MTLQNGTMSDRPVLRIDRLDMTFAPRPWAFAEQRRADIDAHFAACQKKLPALWNGRVLMLASHAIDGAVFRGTFIEVDYAAFNAWHDWGHPEAGVKDCFAQGALRAADGAFLLGVMSPHTANGGRIYFPSGTPDPSDVVGTAVDLEVSVWRELHEETGLTAADVTAERGWHTVPAGPLVAHFKVLQARENAEPLRARICQTLSRQKQPELSDIRIVRGPTDFDPMMPDPIVAFLKAAWRN